MPKSIIKPRSATKAEWESANPILRKQEIGYEVPSAGIGKGKIKMKQGDGVTAWRNLPYASDDVNADEMVVSAFETISEQNPTLSTGSTIKRYISIIKKKFDYYLTLINAKIGTDKIYNALDSSNANQVLAAPAGKQLKQLCDNNAESIRGLNSDLAIKSIGNAVSAPGWTVTASNLVTNGIGLVYGTITHNTDAAPIWGELVGTFPNFSARYNIPVLLFVTSGTVYVTANISQAGELKLYGPDFEKLNIKGKAYQFNAVYYAGN